MKPSEYYTKSNMSGNPFRSNPSVADDPRAAVWVGYDRERRLLEKYIKRSLADQVGSANFLMLRGLLGAGKSHALLWAQHYILHECRKEMNAVCYFVPTLRKDKGQMTFAGAFHEDVLERGGLLEELREFGEFLAAATRDARASEVEATESVLKRLVPSYEHRNLANELIARKDDPSKMRDLVLPPPRERTDYQAMAMFTRLINLFVHDLEVSDSETRRFKNGAYLFIDELDDLQRASSKEVRDMNDTLRHLFDRCPNRFCVIIALTADVTELQTMFFDYVLSRIVRQIELPLLGQDEAVEFVGEILEYSRINPEGDRGYFPFERVAVENVAARIPEITPRKIVNAMHEVIEGARLADHDPEQGPVSLQFLDENDIVEEALHE
jgi:hypothetical protein